MKKRLCLIIALGLIFSTSLSANACFKFWKNKKAEQQQQSTVGISDNKIKSDSSDFEILPTMNTESTAKNRVWVGTFQLIWNDLVDEIVKRPVEFAGTKSVMADNLNKREITASDLSESSYYKKWGLASPKIKKEIEQGIKEKFNETSDILNKFDWTPQEGKYFLYAMLKKDFQYIEPFDKLPDGDFTGSEGSVKYFGIDGNTDYKVKQTVGVLFYNGNNDFAVSLKSKQGDTVYIYRTDDEKTFDLLYKEMQEKSANYTGKKYFAGIDRLKVPMIEFKSEREFPELCNKPIKYTNLMIDKALETVQFKMDETGVKLKSEAGMMTRLTSAGPSREYPRYFYFTNKYTIFLQDDGKTKPYFAMTITDAKKLQK